MTSETRLKVNTEKLGDIRDIIQYLQVLEKVYNHLYAFEFVISDAKLRHKKLNETSYPSWGTSKPGIWGHILISDYSFYVELFQRVKMVAQMA